MKVFAVVNAAGGVGKTTTATTLAVGLSRLLEGGRVLLIDLDPQGDSASTMLGLRPQGYCVSKVIDGRSYVTNGQLDLAAAYKANIMSADRGEEGVYRPNLYVLPSSDRIKDAKTSMIEEVSIRVRELLGSGNHDYASFPTIAKLFTERLNPLRNIFDVIILDCPPSSDAFEDAIFAFADIIIAPTMLDYKSLRSTLLLMNRVTKAQQNDGVHCVVKYMVPTFVDLRTKLAQSMLASLEERYGAYLTISTPVPRTVSVAEGPASGGLTILEYQEVSGNSSSAAEAAVQAYWDLIHYVYDDLNIPETTYA